MPPSRPADPFAIIEAEAARQAAGERAARAVAACRTRLVLGRDAKSAFFATLALRLTPQADDTCSTMATDGRVLAYAPAFVTGLSPDELLGVVAHEVMHNALAQPARRGTRDPAKWNVACDLAVNPLLLAAGFVLPAGRLVPGEGPHAHLPPGKAADEYYARLDPPGRGTNDPVPGADRPDPEPTEENETDADPGGCGGVRAPRAGDPAAAADAEADWRVAVAQAEAAARGRGDLPAGLRRAVEAVLRPPADWRAVLREFVSAAAANDYAWSRPNRRLVWRGLYLPGLYSEELGDVVVAVDTSGSVGPAALAAFAGEVEAILGAFDCSATVLYHDTQVQGVSRWRTNDGPLVLDPVGGGGTSHACVFEWVDREAAGPPACVVCLTDLETEFPTPPPAVPVLWAVPSGCDVSPPFGRRVTLGG